LYKLIGTEHEYERLANAKQTIDHQTKGESLNRTPLQFFETEPDAETETD
jgi:hypothetical protein